MEQIFAQELILPGISGTPMRLQGPPGLGNKFPSIGSIISEAVPYILAFAGLGLLLMIIAAGFSMLTSAGDPKKLEAGKERLTNGLIGFFLIIAAYWIVQITGAIFGIEEIRALFPW
jgi:hypothetical protein